MPIENADYIGQLDPTNPPNTDNPAEGAAQIRLTKKATVQTFPNLDAEVDCAPDDLNQLTDVLLTELMPVGAVMMWATTTPPNGWLECDGVAIPPANTALIALVGANTPNLADKFVRGASVARDPLTTEVENVGGHDHQYNSWTGTVIEDGGADTDNTYSRPTTLVNNQATHNNPAGENIPANTALMYIIKT